MDLRRAMWTFFVLSLALVSVARSAVTVDPVTIVKIFPVPTEPVWTGTVEHTVSKDSDVLIAIISGKTTIAVDQIQAVRANGKALRLAHILDRGKIVDQNRDDLYRMSITQRSACCFLS